MPRRAGSPRGIRYILAQELSVSVPPLNVRRYIILEEGGNTCLIQFQEHARRQPLNFSSAVEVAMLDTYHVAECAFVYAHTYALLLASYKFAAIIGF